MEEDVGPFRSLMRFYEAEARYSASGLAADRRALLPEHKAKPNVQVALEVDVPRAMTLFEDRLCRR